MTFFHCIYIIGTPQYRTLAEESKEMRQKVYLMFETWKNSSMGKEMQECMQQIWEASKIRTSKTMWYENNWTSTKMMFFFHCIIIYITRTPQKQVCTLVEEIKEMWDETVCIPCFLRLETKSSRNVELRGRNAV